MAERFERIFSLQEDLWGEGSPLILEAGALLLDKQLAKFLVQLKFKNIGQKMPVSVTVKIVEMDSNQKPLGTQTEFTYTNLSASRGEEFGVQTPIFIGNPDIRAFGASIQKVVFSDASVFSAEDRLLSESLPSPISLKSWLKDDDAVDEYHAQFGKSACHKPEQYHDIWRCTCGSINAASEKQCHSCQCVLEEISKVDPVILQNDNKYKRACAFANTNSIANLQAAIKMFSSIREWKDSEVQITTCQERIDTINATAKRRSKIRKISVITSVLIFAVFVGTIFLVDNVIIPNGKYKDAVSLMNFGKYTEAIEAFTALDGYKDSNTQIQNCKKAILDDKYNTAIALMNNGKIVEAYEALITLDGYKDSTEKASSIYEEYKVEKLKTAKVGDHIFFGAYEQDNNTLNGKENIEWLVLDKKDGKVLVISNHILTYMPFGGSTWETSEVRKWLNGSFYSSAFTKVEANLIVKTEVETPSYYEKDTNFIWNFEETPTTNDKLFCLSIQEYKQYNPAEAIPTPYATQHYVKDVFYDNTNEYLSRSTASTMGAVSTLGYGHSAGQEIGSHYGVRPVMWVETGE